MVLGMVVLAGGCRVPGEHHCCLISMVRVMDGSRQPHNSVSSFGLTMAERRFDSCKLFVQVFECLSGVVQCVLTICRPRKAEIVLRYMYSI
jgi:hypothetical protein